MPINCSVCVSPVLLLPDRAQSSSPCLITLQEVMTDPSYKGQFVCFTCPHIGNVGINTGEQLRVTWARVEGQAGIAK